MATILGMINAESFESERFKNVRRTVFYFLPNGAAPLTGLLSLLKEEVTYDPEFKHYEKRLAEQRTTTASIGTSSIYTGITVAGGVVTAGTEASGNVTFTAGTQYAIKTADNPDYVFRIAHVIKIRFTNTSGNIEEVIGRVTAVNSHSAAIADVIGFIAINTVGTAIDYDLAANLSCEVLAIGSAYAEGSLDISSNIYTQPVQPMNYCQIFRAPFTLTGTGVHTSAKYDETGVYKDMAKEASVNYMLEMEKHFMFGYRSLNTAAGVPVRTTGGLLWHLRQWEAGSTYGNTAASSDTDDNKRIIVNSSGKITSKRYDGFLERAFRVTNNKSNEKLVLCGSGYLQTVNQMYFGRSVLTVDMPMTATFGMDVVKHRTPFGTIYYKSHPLMSQNAILRYNAFIIDVQNLVYRYLDGRDVQLLKNRQAPDADYRKDEWLGECGMEVRFPESHMYLQNFQDYEAS